MSKEKHGQKELLHNPRNWAFWAFFLSPILPAIFYYRNSKILGTASSGKKVLAGSILFVMAFLVPATIFSYYGTPLVISGALIAALISKKLAKGQLDAYEKMKKEKGLKGGRNDVPLAFAFFAAWIAIALIPFAIDLHIEKNYLRTRIGGEEVYLPRSNAKEKAPQGSSVVPAKIPSDPQEQKAPEIKGKIALTLPKGYALGEKNESVFEKSYQYKVLREDGSLDTSSWRVLVVPLEAVQHFDAICAPGDCMRDFLIFPTEENYLSDLKGIEKDGEPAVTLLNGQKYYALTLPVNGDGGYNRQYITYFDDVRVLFSSWAENQERAENQDAFMEEVKIVSIE